MERSVLSGRAHAAALLAALAWSNACAPEIADGRFSCVSSHDECPEGFTCELDQRCHEAPLSSCGTCGDVDQNGTLSSDDVDLFNLLRKPETNLSDRCVAQSVNINAEGDLEDIDRAHVGWLATSATIDELPPCEMFGIVNDEPRSCDDCDREPGDANNDDQIDIDDWNAIISFPCAFANVPMPPPFCSSVDACTVRSIDLNRDGRLSALDAEMWRQLHCPESDCVIPTDQSLSVCPSRPMIRTCLLLWCDWLRPT